MKNLFSPFTYKCKHLYFGKVEDGYQYCKECGVAIVAPKRECEHKWKIKETIKKQNTITYNIYKITHVLQCEKCGDIKIVEI